MDKSVYEKLRCEEIEVRNDDLHVSSFETSDEKMLCKHPLVSISMLAYNHAKYIKQAVLSIVCQKTDFEYELIIGEDASQDETRAICFELQRQFPDKIRVVWSDANVGASLNAKRIQDRYRGEFIAYCEGDDYWLDENRLQKQVDIFRKHPNVGLCFGQAKIANELTGGLHLWSGEAFPSGVIPSKAFFLWYGFGRSRIPLAHKDSFLMTASIVVRRSVLDEARRRYDAFRWKLAMGDATAWLAVVSLSDAYFIKTPISVYRQNPGGVTMRSGARVARDGTLIRFYYAQKVLGISVEDSLRFMGSQYAQILFCFAASLSKEKRREFIARVMAFPPLMTIFKSFRTYPMWACMRLGLVSRFWVLWCSRIALRLPMFSIRNSPFNKLYDEVETKEVTS